MLRRLIITLALSLITVAAGIEASRADNLIEESTFLPAQIDGRVYRLETMIVRPQNPRGPMPIALLAHGRNSTLGYRNQKTTDMLQLARELARRGYLAAIVIRRGFGRSDGESDGGVRGSCQEPHYRAMLGNNGHDYAAALAALQRRSDVDPTRAVAIGGSSGGATMIGLAGLSPRGLLGVVNMAGGESKVNNEGPCYFEQGLIDAVAFYGSRSRIPTLWLYAGNDSFVNSKNLHLNGAQWGDRLATAFRRAGGRADFVNLGTVGKEGHYLGSGEGLNRSMPFIEQFLQAYHLPTWDRALIDEAVRAGNLSPEGRKGLETYLALWGEKFFVVSASGRTASWSARGEKPKERALASCQQKGEPCRVLLENFEMVPDVTASNQGRKAGG